MGEGENPVTTVSATATTDAYGNYTFTDLPSDVYTLHFLAPPGYGWSTAYGGDPYGEENNQQTATDLIDTNVSASFTAGLVRRISIGDGTAFAVAAGQGFTGVVGTIDDPTWWPTSIELDTTIDWGDGTVEDGTLVNDSGTLEVTGEHTYAAAGFYALSIGVRVPDAGWETDAVRGFAYVLPTTDNSGPEWLVSASATGGTTIPGDGVDGGITDSSATFAYSFSETVDEVGATFTETRAGTASFTETSGTIAVHVSESSTRNEVDNSPEMIGTATEVGTQNFVQSLYHNYYYYGDSVWGRIGTYATIRYEAETVPDGTYTATEIDSGSKTSIPFGADAWSGPETTTRIETGNHGPQSYSETRIATGTQSGPSSSSGYPPLYYWNEYHTGTYTLSRTTSQTGGSGNETGTGSYVQIDANDGTTFVNYDMENYGRTNTATESGVVTTATTTETGLLAYGGGVRITVGDDDGSYTVSSYGLGPYGFQTATTTATTVNQGVTATQLTYNISFYTTTERGTIGSGSYTLSGTATNAQIASTYDVDQGDIESATQRPTVTATTSQSGDRFTGDYTLSETDTQSGSSSDNSAQGSTQTPGGGITGIHLLGDVGTGTGSGSATISRTGNLATGSYTLHETSTATATSTDTSSENSGGSATAGSTDSDSESNVDTQREQQTTTLDQTGNHLTGSYSLHQTSSDTTTVTGTAAVARRGTGRRRLRRRRVR